jgi:hypothetical protein
MTQEERLSLSKKIVEIPAQNASLVTQEASINEALATAQTADNLNKTIFDTKNSLVSLTQAELNLLDGKDRTLIVETDLVEAAQQTIGNKFFPNKQGEVPPTLNTDVWKFFPPYFLGYGLGKTKLEAYNPLSSDETSILASINASISTLDTYAYITQVTGQECIVVPPDTVQTSSAIHTDMTTLEGYLATLSSLLTSEIAAINALSAGDPDPSRVSENNAALVSITAIQTALSTWLAIQAFSPIAVPPGSCPLFDAYDPNLLPNSRLKTSPWTTFKAAIVSRGSFVVSREAQLSSRLGTFSQSMIDGSFSGSGFYYDRAQAINLRLNRTGGSLIKVENIKNGKNFVQQSQSFNNSSNTVYSGLMAASLLKAPTNGTSLVHLKDSSDFSVGNKVYLASESLGELEAVIQNIVGLAVTLNIKVQPGYNIEDKARLYRVK